MSRQVVAKFGVSEVARVHQYDNKIHERVRFFGVYSQDPEHENKKFWDATPIINFEMTISNPGAQGFFQPGKEYYVNFVEAGE